MYLIPKIKSVAVVLLSSTVIFTSQMAAVARAEMVTTDTALSRYSAYADRSFLLDELEKEEVRQEILNAGVDPVEAEKRLRALTDEEVAQLVQQIQEGEAGGSSIIGALMTVFIILLVTDLLCLTKVFPFTRCAR